MTNQRHDRIIPLDNLNSYPGSEWLDTIIFLPGSEDPLRHIWLHTPQSTPVLQILDTLIEPQSSPQTSTRWVDYGVIALPFLMLKTWSGGDFVQLRLRGMNLSECTSASLLVTRRLDLSFEGCTLEDAESKLWNLTRDEAGSTSIRPSRVGTGSPATFTVRYEAGPNGLPPCALVRFTVAKAFAEPQTQDAAAPGFTTVIEKDCPVSIARIEQSVESHEKYDIICRLESALAPHQAFHVSYVTDKTYIYPCEFHKTDRAFWYSLLPPLAAAVAIAEDMPFVSLAEKNGHAVEFVPGVAERLHLFLPGRRYASERLTLRGTFTDHYRNCPPAGPLPSNIDLWLENGIQRIALGTPANHLVAGHRFELALPRLAPGIYRVFAYASGTRTEFARSNPMEIIDQGMKEDRLYWGEIHGHTEMSDGSGDFSELYRHAKEEGSLEFAAACDHSENFSDNQWRQMQDTTNGWNEPGRFVTLVGYEWGGKPMHRNVYTSRDELYLFRGRHLATSHLAEVWKRFHGDNEVVGGPHGSLAHGLLWEEHDPDVERFIEVYSMWGASDFRASPLVDDEAKFNPRGMTINEILLTGAKLGFTAGSDCHEGHAGFTSEDPDGQGTTSHTFALRLDFRGGMMAAVMPRLDRPILISTIRNRQTYATTGARILLDFSVSGLPMGSTGTALQVVCRAIIHAVQPIHVLEIVKDGQVVWNQGCNDLDAAIEWSDGNVDHGQHYYYLHVVQIDGHMAWSSPVWVSRE